MSLLYSLMLRSASLLVPSARRREWFREWSTELWYVSRARGSALRFCLGAFYDAWWFRQENSAASPLSIETGAQCLTMLASVSAFTMMLALAPPPARHALEDQFRVWRGHAGSPRYRVERYWVRVSGRPGTVGYVIRPKTLSPDAGLIVRPGSRFGRPGTVVTLSGIRTRVVAMASEHGCWLPASVDAALGDCRYGRDVVKHAPGWLISFWPNLLVACLIVPVASSLCVRDLLGIRRWAFLTVKIALIIPALFFGAINLAFLPLPVPVLLYQSSFWGAIFAFRWALLDQRERCPVCLRRLAKPVRVGESSYIFLDWHGTERMCPRGHGLMHVAEGSSLWFSGQRWMALDASWTALFP